MVGTALPQLWVGRRGAALDLSQVRERGSRGFERMLLAAGELPVATHTDPALPEALVLEGPFDAHDSPAWRAGAFLAHGGGWSRLRIRSRRERKSARKYQGQEHRDGAMPIHNAMNSFRSL